MNFICRSKDVDVKKPHIVKRSTDGRYAIRQIKKDGTKMYLTLYGDFARGCLDKLDMPSGARNWVSELYQHAVISEGCRYSEWTNNIRALRKVLNYKEDVVEGSSE